MKIINMDIIQNGAKIAFNFVKKNAPHFLTGTAVVGVITTSIFAAKGVIKARDILEAEEELRANKLFKDCEESNLYPENNNIPPSDLISKQITLSKKEKIKLIWKPLLPMVVSGITTITCIIGSDIINTGRNAALLAMASASEKALEQYQKKNIELFGDKNHQKVLDERACDEVKKSDIPEEDMIIKTGSGDMLIYDSWNGRYIRGSRDAIDKAANSLNYDMYRSGSIFDDGFTNLNDFYESIKVYEMCQCGDDLGWNKLYPILIEYSSVLKDDDTPVMVMSFKNIPLAKYALPES